MKLAAIYYKWFHNPVGCHSEPRRGEEFRFLIPFATLRVTNSGYETSSTRNPACRA
jgi:hypothetical protein